MKLPHFICVGAMRSGTTTLWAELRAHSEIFMPKQKELHFFDRDFDLGVEAYAAHFDEAREDQIRGEFTPAYMYRDNWRRRLQETLPEAKLIIILRDPVERAWSHYRYSVRWGSERLGFRQAIQLEPMRITRDYESLVWFSYLTRGYYVDQLEALQTLHGAEKLNIVFFDSLIRNRLETLNEIRTFLGLKAPFSEIPVPRENEILDFPRSVPLHGLAQRVIKSEDTSLLFKMSRKIARWLQERNLMAGTPRLDPDIAADLAKCYALHDQRLEQFLQRRVPWRVEKGAD